MSGRMALNRTSIVAEPASRAGEMQEDSLHTTDDSLYADPTLPRSSSGECDEAAESDEEGRPPTVLKIVRKEVDKFKKTKEAIAAVEIAVAEKGNAITVVPNEGDIALEQA